MGDVRIDGITKRYADVVAVNDLNIEIEDGEFVTLVGPSGCGKSTTLESLAGLTEPSEGSIYIAGNDVTDKAPKDRNIAMVFQNIALFPHLDVFDNISYGLQIRKFDRDVIEQKVDEAIEILQLDGMIDRMPGELSGGQRQRVGIGRAIVRDPDVFLMDEPLANLDAKLRVHMRTEIQRIQRKLGVTTIYVTHDQEEAMTMSDRIAIMNEGRLQQIAPPLECYNRPANAFVAGFIGSPSMNFYTSTLVGGELECQSFPTAIEAPPLSNVEDGAELTIGVRPEDISFADDADLAFPSRPIDVTIDVIEPLGDGMLVYMLLDEETQDELHLSDEGRAGQLLMRAEPDVDLTEGDQKSVVFDRSNLHLFDTVSGDAIVHGFESTPGEGSSDSMSAATDD